MQFLGSAGESVDRSKNTIADLVEQRKALQQQKKDLSRQLRNATRKRRRLLAKSSQLSSMDLVEVLQIRSAREASREARIAEEDAAAREAS